MIRRPVLCILALAICIVAIAVIATASKSAFVKVVALGCLLEAVRIIAKTSR